MMNDEKKKEIALETLQIINRIYRDDGNCLLATEHREPHPETAYIRLVYRVVTLAS